MKHHVENIIEEYEDLSLFKVAIQPIKSGMGTVSSLLELSTDAIEEVREDLRVSSPKERELMSIQLDVKIAKYRKQLNAYKAEEVTISTNEVSL